MKTLGWALLHFVWQGALLGAALIVVLRSLRSYSPQTRYLAACVVLAVMAATVPITAIVLSSGSLGTTAASELPPGLPVTLDAEPVSYALLYSLSAWCGRNLSLLVAMWALGASLLLLRAGGGWYLARRQSRLGLPLDYPLSILMERLDMTGTVEIYRSATALTPQVFGWVKPVIVVPLAALAQLSPAQLEALLVHELAHIRRHDYFVNLLQTLVESLLFYHPAVWWVSATIRRERELCCDDLAVEICGDRIEYSQALLKLEEVTPAMSIAASGSGLKERIARLLSSNHSNGWTWSAPLAPVLAVSAAALLLSGVWLAQGAPPVPPAPPAPPVPAVAPAPADSPAPAAPPVVSRLAGQAPPAPPAPPAEPRPAPEPAPAPPDQEEIRVAIEQSKRDIERALAELQSNKAKIQEDMLRAMEQTKQLREQMNTEEAKRAIERALSDLDRQKEHFARQLEQAQRQLERSVTRSAEAKERAERAQQRAEERRKERDRRIEFADKKWGTGSVAGSKTGRGRHYVQYGPPDEIETPQGGGEIWRYRNWQNTGGTISFEFDKEGNKK